VILSIDRFIIVVLFVEGLSAYMIVTSSFSLTAAPNSASALQNGINMFSIFPNGSTISNQGQQNSSLLMVSLDEENNSLLAGTAYTLRVSQGNGTVKDLFVTDNGPNDSSPLTDGLIWLKNAPPGRYNITQTRVPQGLEKDPFSRIISLDGSDKRSTSLVFLSQPAKSQSPQPNLEQVADITYPVKFECGSIYGNEGPLRPGHYDTDISVLNRQEIPIKVSWNVATDNGQLSPSIVKSLESGSSFSIVCKEIRSLLNYENTSYPFEEGFVTIRPIVDIGSLGSFLDSSQAILNNPQQMDALDVINVQVFYTANTLEHLPKEIVLQMVSFILSNSSGSVSMSIPSDLLGKRLDVTLPTTLNEISDPQLLVENELQHKYNLSSEQADELGINIIDVKLGVGTLLDDHAISLSRIEPELVFQQ
jgi:hypothetical protein